MPRLSFVPKPGKAGSRAVPPGCLGHSPQVTAHPSDMLVIQPTQAPVERAGLETCIKTEGLDLLPCCSKTTSAPVLGGGVP